MSRYYTTPTSVIHVPCQPRRRYNTGYSYTWKPIKLPLRILWDKRTYHVRHLELKKMREKKSGLASDLAHTVKKRPYEDEREDVILTRVHQFTKPARQISRRLSLTVDGIHHEGCEEDRDSKQNEPSPILQPQNSSHSSRKTGGNELDRGETLVVDDIWCEMKLGIWIRGRRHLGGHWAVERQDESCVHVPTATAGHSLQAQL